jgi:hypothetical protein
LRSMWRFRTLALLAALTCATPFLLSRQASTSQPLAEPSNSTQGVPPTKGLVENGIYKNPSIRLEFTPAKGLRLKEPTMKGTPGTTPLIISIQAETDPGAFYGLTVFIADALAYYPEDQRNASRYLLKVIRANTADGFQQIDGKTSEQVNGISFVRADFVKGQVHETVLVTTQNAYAYSFIFAGADIAVTDRLIASTNIKLNE